jgi:UDP-N-acetylmuramate--alanine ligase
VIEPDLTQPIPESIERVHFIGIGGSGMSGIAHMMLDAGLEVSGSDRSGSATVDRLVERGATVAIGHDAANLATSGEHRADAVVVTSALWPDNPELVAAREHGIPVLHRSQALHVLARGKRVVAVAGAHGKTTTTGMLVVGLHGLGIDAGFVNGGIIGGLGASSGHGSSDVFVLEADESDGSFLLYDVAVALITNVDTDHLDHYGTPEAFDAAFAAFANRASEAVVISADDPGALRVREHITHERVVTFGEAEGADVRIVDVQLGESATCTVEVRGERIVLEAGVPGRHNAVNAAGALATLVALGIAPGDAARALAAFRGTGRRFELHGERRGVRVFDDYAHHPAEVDAALTAARTVIGEGRIIAIHQPHLYTRTRDMAGEFAAVYERVADHTVVLDVYGAREDPIPGVTGALVADRFADAGDVDYLPDWQQAAERAAALAREGDIIVTLSCGDVYRIIPQVLSALEEGGEA